MSTHDALFQPWQLGRLSLPNRLALAPMTRISATPDGLASAAMQRYYQRFAQGGFGLLITEGLYTDQAFSQGYAGQPGLSDARQAKAWRPIVDAVHKAGGAIVAQLMHAGALSQANRFRDTSVGPSAIQPKGEQMASYHGSGPYRLPRAMSEAEIAEAVDGFAQAARLAVEVAGFDAVEIHGANGYLLDQFLTDYSNQREDGWGGDIVGRARLSLEVSRAVRQSVGSEVPVGLRLSQSKVNDFEHRWAGAEADALRLFGALAQADLDYLHLTAYEAWRPAFGSEGPSLTSLARRSLPTMSLIANGGLHEPERALQSLGDGADLVALARGALANPDWPQRLRRGLALKTFDPALLSPQAGIKASELDQPRG